MTLCCTRREVFQSSFCPSVELSERGRDQKLKCYESQFFTFGSVSCPAHAESIMSLAGENIRFSSLFIAGDVSQGGKSATLRQKFHTSDANQCLNDKFGCHGVPNINLSNFTCLVVDFGKVLCSTSSSNRLKCFFQRGLYSTNIDSFIRHSSRSHLAFEAFYLS